MLFFFGLDPTKWTSNVCFSHITSCSCPPQWHRRASQVWNWWRCAWKKCQQGIIGQKKTDTVCRYIRGVEGVTDRIGKHSFSWTLNCKMENPAQTMAMINRLWRRGLSLWMRGDQTCWNRGVKERQRRMASDKGARIEKRRLRLFARSGELENRCREEGREWANKWAPRMRWEAYWINEKTIQGSGLRWGNKGARSAWNIF